MASSTPGDGNYRHVTTEESNKAAIEVTGSAGSEKTLAALTAQVITSTSTDTEGEDSQLPHDSKSAEKVTEQICIDYARPLAADHKILDAVYDKLMSSSSTVEGSKNVGDQSSQMLQHSESVRTIIENCNKDTYNAETITNVHRASKQSCKSPYQQPQDYSKINANAPHSYNKAYLLPEKREKKMARQVVAALLVGLLISSLVILASGVIIVQNLHLLNYASSVNTFSMTDNDSITEFNARTGAGVAFQAYNSASRLDNNFNNFRQAELKN